MHLGKKKRPVTHCCVTPICMLEEHCWSKWCCGGEKLAHRSGKSVPGYTVKTHQSLWARLCPDLNPVFILILREDEIKTESDPTALPTFCLLCFLNHVGNGLMWTVLQYFGYSFWSFKSCQETQSMSICNSIWLHFKKPTQNYKLMKKQYLWPLLLQKTLRQPIGNPFSDSILLKALYTYLQMTTACTLLIKSHFLLFLCLREIAKKGTLMAWFFAAVLLFLFRYK